MRKILPILLLSAGTVLSAQSHEGPVSSRFGLNFQVMLPTDTAGSLYKTGYAIGIPFYFRQGEDVEGRLRVEIGHFDGKNRTVFGETESISADTRYIGYDWLIKMGPGRAPGVDFLIGIGGAHWYQSITRSHTPGSDIVYVDDGYGEKIAFVLSVGFIFHINSHVGIEAKQMLTSLPNSQRDFHDADLSHTSLGVAFRF